MSRGTYLPEPFSAEPEVEEKYGTKNYGAEPAISSSPATSPSTVVRQCTTGRQEPPSANSAAKYGRKKREGLVIDNVTGDIFIRTVLREAEVEEKYGTKNSPTLYTTHSRALQPARCIEKFFQHLRSLKMHPHLRVPKLVHTVTIYLPSPKAPSS